MRKEFLSFSPPYLSDQEIQAVTAVLKTDWLSSGPKTAEFEKEFAAAVQAKAALALNSCTAALHISLLAEDVGPGDEVITTAMTFCATANVIEHVGAKTVLADVEPDTLLIDVKDIEKRITKKTKAIIPVHYAGHGVDMNALNKLAQKHGIKVIEDAAHCLPAKIDGKPIGASDNLTCFSFYATKNMTTGEGGMLTGPEEKLDKARMIALHGMSRGAWKRYAKGGNWKYDVPAPGFKYNMSDIMSAIGLVQLKRLPELYERRMAIVKRYDEAFKRMPWIQPLKVKPGYQSSHHLYAIRLDVNQLKIDRDQFITELAERQIGTGVHYIPIHMMSYYANKYGWKPSDFPVSQSQFERMLSIPLCSRMTVSDADDVIAAIDDIFKKFAK